MWTCLDCRSRLETDWLDVRASTNTLKRVVDLMGITVAISGIFEYSVNRKQCLRST